MGKRNPKKGDGDQGAAPKSGVARRGPSESARYLDTALKDPKGMNQYHQALLKDVYGDPPPLEDSQIRFALTICGQTLTLARLQIMAKYRGAKPVFGLAARSQEG